MVNFVFLSVYFYSVPNLRFPSFSHDWKIYTFDDIASYKKGPFGSALKKDLFVPKSKESVKVYEQQNAINKDCHLERYFISANYYEKMKSFTVYPGDTIVSCAGTIGELYTLPENADIGIINQALMIIRNNQAIILKDFLNIQFSRMIDEFSKTYSNGSAIKNIPPFSDLKRKKTYVPDKLEQEKIIKFISLLDQKITTQIKIIELKQSLIKDIEDKLLWKSASTYSRHISDFLTELNDKSKIQNQYPLLSSTKKGLFLQTDYFNKEAASSNNIGYKIVHEGDIIISPQNLWMGNITYNDKFVNGLVSPSYRIYKVKEEYNAYYISRILMSYRALSLYKNISEQGASIVRRNLNVDAFNELCFPIPNIKKQDEVSLFLSKLHQELNSEIEILRQLKNQKKYLLCNMFI